MWNISALARQALRGSHQITVRATAYATIGEQPGIPIIGGTITSDAKSKVRRSGTVEVGDPDLFPVAPIAALSPISSELAVEYGVIVPGQAEPEWIPVIRGPIQKVSAGWRGKLSVEVADRSAGVGQDRLDVPSQTQEGTFIDEITRLIRETQPLAEVVDLTGDTREAPTLEIDTDRWGEGIEKLADGIGAEVFTDAAGRYVVRPQPTFADPVAWVIDAGEGGVMVDLKREFTRERVYNAVVARGERTDGTAPVYAKWVDDDPASPTFYGGPFGKRVRFYSSPLLTTVEQCYATAQALGERAKGIVATVQVTAIANPALEAGDVILIALPDGTTQRHIIDAVPIPLGLGTQQLTTRSVDALPAEQGAE
jgi:hypothetical protein